MEHTVDSKVLFYRKLLRRSLWALGVSGVLNIFAFAYIAIEFEEGSMPFLGSLTFSHNKQLILPFDSPKLFTLQGELVALKNESFESLTKLLQDREPLSDGYKRQDLALSLLASMHHLNLAKALPGVTLTRRSVKIGSFPFHLYTGVSDEQYAAIIDFIETERYPFTFQGIYTLLKRGECDQAACREAREYQELERLLIHDGKITKENAYQLILAADCPLLAAWLESKNPAMRRLFLTKLLSNAPKEAAVALVETDFRYALHHLDDQTSLLLLKSIPEGSAHANKYALGLLLSPRSEVVWKEVQLYLCQKEKLDPAKTTRAQLLTHFGIAKPKAAAKPATKPIISKPVIATSPKKIPPHVKKKEIVHIVKSGDTLWALSKKYKVDVQLIKKHNGLKSDALQPGTALRIPTQR